MRTHLRMVALSVLVASLWSVAAWGQEGRPEYTLFDNGNIYAVQNGPQGPTLFTLKERCRITRITDYHWNNAQGSPPGSISLRDGAGNIIGRWRATTRPGQGGVPNAYWDVFPDVTLEAGTYSILDSDPSTWSCNAENNHLGMSQVYGRPRRH